VFGRTGSAAWAAATYALTFLPALVGGVLLGRLADLCPRRRVMLACDLVRAVLVALMALPGTSLPVLCALLVAVVLLAPLHTAALGALLPEVVPGPVFDTALTLRYVTGQVAQVGGFALGGLLVAALSPSAALTLDAASFVVSALVVRLGVAERPVPAAGRAGPASRWWVDAREACAPCWATAGGASLVCAAWLVGCFVLPEALAVPTPSSSASTPPPRACSWRPTAGSVLGAWLFTRFVPTRCGAAIGPLAVAAALPLGICGTEPGFRHHTGLWGISGAFVRRRCLVQAQAEFVRVTPPASCAAGRSGSPRRDLIGAQGLAVLLGGVVARCGGRGRRWRSAAP
jgi:MFS family permease